MADREITVTLPEILYERGVKLVEDGLFADLNEVLRAGLRQVLLEAAILEGQAVPFVSAGSERFGFYLLKFRQEIAEAGGWFPGKTSEEVIEALRQTREEIYEQKYAAHFRQQ